MKTSVYLYHTRLDNGGGRRALMILPENITITMRHIVALYKINAYQRKCGFHFSCVATVQITKSQSEGGAIPCNRISGARIPSRCIR